MYAALIIGLVVIGLTASTFYVVTWGYGAFKAAVHGRTTLTRTEIIDFGALPFGAWLVLLLNLVNIIDTGVVLPATTGLAFQRVFTVLIIVLIVLFRVIRWMRRWLATPKAERMDGAALVDRGNDGAS